MSNNNLEKNILDIDDLLQYCSKYKRSMNFDSKKTGYSICIQTPGSLLFDQENDNIKGLLPVKLQCCHTGLNNNNFYISDENMSNALPSLKNRPILADIHKVNNRYEFGRHNMYENEDGEIVYIEKPVGAIPDSSEINMVYDEQKQKNYVETTGYIYEEYSQAAEILRRDKQSDVSVELFVNKLSYNAQNKYIELIDFYFKAVTILGKDEYGRKIIPGMAGSNIKLLDFDSNRNSMCNFNEIETKFNIVLNNINNLKDLYLRGGHTEMKLQSLLDKYQVTLEDLNFDYQDLSDEELEIKFEEMFSQNNSEEGKNNQVEKNNNFSASSNNSENNDPESNNFNSVSNNFSKVFEISHDDIRKQLYQLLQPVEHADHTDYYINKVFNNYFVYSSYEEQNVYGQKYVINNDVVAFNGERYALHVEYLTDSEYQTLNEMRENYNELVQYRQENENSKEFAKKLQILSDSKFECINKKDTDGNYVNLNFSQLVDDINKYSVEEVEEKAKSILGEYFINFNKKPVYRQIFNAENEEHSNRYGSLFSK